MVDPGYDGLEKFLKKCPQLYSAKLNSNHVRILELPRSHCSNPFVVPLPQVLGICKRICDRQDFENLKTGADRERKKASELTLDLLMFCETLYEVAQQRYPRLDASGDFKGISARLWTTVHSHYFKTPQSGAVSTIRRSARILVDLIVSEAARRIQRFYLTK